MTARMPDNEDDRLATLHEHRMLDSSPEQEFDDLTRLAAHICGVPTSAVSLIDSDRQRFQSIHDLDSQETPHALAFCAHTVLGSDFLIVPDTQKDARYADNPLVTGNPHIRFYAGASLLTEDGHALGSLCVIDTVPHQLTPDQQDALRALVRQARAQLDMRRRLTLQECRMTEQARVTAVRDLSERKTIESALESQAFIKAVLDNSTSMIYVFDLDTMSNVYANRDLGEFWGYSPDQIQAMGGELVARVVHPDDMPYMLSHFGDFAHIPDGQVVEFETRCRHADGEWRWVRVREVVFLRHADGTAYQIMGTAQDVTEKKQADAALQESEARLAEAQRVASIGSWTFDITSMGITWSDELFRLFEMDPAEDEPSYEALKERYHPDDVPMHAAFIEQAMRDGLPYEFDIRIVRRDGTFRWAHAIGRGEQAADGSITRLFGTLMDIHERKMLEADQRESAELLHRSEAALRAVLESAPIILYAADAGGTVTLSEGTGLAVLGLKPGEVVGRSVFEFRRGDTEREDPTRRALAGESVSYDSRVDGLYLHTKLRPVRDAAGTVTGIIGVCFDVTERALAEERFRVLFEQSSDAHLLCGAGGIIDCNNATLGMLRCANKAQILGTHPGLLSPEYQPDGRRSGEKGHEMEAVAHERGSHHFEWIHRRTDGEEFPAEVWLTPVTLASGTATLAVLHDLTERKRAEEQIKDHAVVLEFQKWELEKANAELAAMATTDGLTGLSNHRAFQERLTAEVARAVRYGIPLSVVLLDVDHFKQYNDAFGHPAGDEVLRAVSRLLRRGARDTDLVARYGGEEFVLVLPQTDLEGATALAERIRESMTIHPWPLRDTTASFGVASLRPGDKSGAELVSRADVALYTSKQGGRNRVECGITVSVR